MFKPIIVTSTDVEAFWKRSNHAGFPTNTV